MVFSFMSKPKPVAAPQRRVVSAAPARAAPAARAGAGVETSMAAANEAGGSEKILGGIRFAATEIETIQALSRIMFHHKIGRASCRERV